jgi:UrcA family protein
MHTQSRTTSPVRRLVAIAIAGIALSSISALSSARSPDPLFAAGEKPLQVRVRFADLDISSQEGAHALYYRIRWAALEVCSPIQSRGYYMIDRRDACIDEAITNAVNTVNRPALTAIWTAKRATWPTARYASQSHQ